MAGPAYREYTPRAPLDRLVECLWTLSQSSGGSDRDPQRIPPDGTVELILHLHDPFDQVAEQGLRRQPAAMVVGVWTRAIALVAPDRFDTIGVRFRPGAASAFWSEPLDAFADTVVDATALWGRAVESLREELCETPDVATRIAVIDRFLIGKMQRSVPALAEPLARIAASRGCASIDAVAAAAGVSHRQLERAFRTHVGVPPKVFSRIVRFQHALRSAPETPRAWADVALACGYADQSHLIRDFTQFAGETPTMLLESEAAVANYFRRR